MFDKSSELESVVSDLKRIKNKQNKTTTTTTTTKQNKSKQTKINEQYINDSQVTILANIKF